uniref:G-protein coupled receptors family 1 profile domain-containing protein n=1 Tax=Neogobius melanostomus TaxID=47308 RepID=A0A8C6SQL8_9GOBI
MNVEETNSSIFHPTFYINGFHNFAHGRYYYIFLCFVYVVTVFGNVVLLLIIFLVRDLHTLKYMIVFNLAMIDLCGSTALIPKLLDTFLFENRYIAYEACLSYMFFVLLFGTMQSWTLATMAFDRFIAICFPLHYHSIVTKPSVAVIIVGLVNRLSFCASVVVQSFYCDHAPVYRLACSSTAVNQKLALFGGVIMFLVPLALIGCSYGSIAFALKQKVPGGERLKALKTSVYFPNFHPNTRMINSTLTHTVPSLLNPFIYSLKTEEVLTVIKKICWRCRACSKY